MKRQPAARQRHWGRALAACATAVVALVAPAIATAPSASAAPIAQPATCPTDIIYGQLSSCVSTVQQQLHNQGYSWLAVDGSFGPDTLIAVLSFQSSRGLYTDGDVGPDTKAALSAAKPISQNVTRQTVAAILALQNRNGKACTTNTLGGKGFRTSCTGNGGLPEYWCSDYVGWVWEHSYNSGAGITAWAPTVYSYGVNHGTAHTSSTYLPRVGDAITYSNSTIQHVGIVVAMNPTADSAVIISGDTHGTGSTQAAYAGSSKVWIDVASAGKWRVGQTPSYTSYHISSYVTPVA